MPIETIYDAIRLDGLPGDTDVLTAGTEMEQVDEPLEFSSATAGELNLGDTADIGGTTYTIVGLNEFEADMDDSVGTETVSGHIVELEDGSGGTLTYMLLDDGYGNKIDITQAAMVFVDPAASPVSVQIYEVNDTVTLGITCYVSGTRIRTLDGERAIEDLCAGDLVVTGQDEALPIVWIGYRKLGPDQLVARPDLLPFRIRKGFLGNTRDLLVSPQHCMAVKLADEATPRLIKAKHLAEVAPEMVRVAKGKKQVTYHHLLLPRHALIWAEGCLSESLFPGQLSISSLDTNARREIFTLFPDLSQVLLDAKIAERVYGRRVLEVIRRRDWAFTSQGCGINCAL